VTVTGVVDEFKFATVTRQLRQLSEKGHKMKPFAIRHVVVETMEDPRLGEAVRPGYVIPYFSMGELLGDKWRDFKERLVEKVNKDGLTENTVIHMLVEACIMHQSLYRYLCDQLCPSSNILIMHLVTSRGQEWLLQSMHQFAMETRAKIIRSLEEASIHMQGEQENKLVGKPVGATDTRRGEMTNAAQSEEIWPVSCQQGERVEYSVVTERVEQQLQAVSNTLGEDSVEDNFESLYLVEEQVYEYTYRREVRDITDLGGEKAGDGGTVDEETVYEGHPGEEVHRDLHGGGACVMVAISDKKLDLGEVDKIINQGAEMMAIKNKEHEFRDTGGGDTVVGETINKGHPGEERHVDLLVGDEEESHRGGDYVGDGGTVDGEVIDVGHPDEKVSLDLLVGDGDDSHHGEVRDISDLGGDIAGDGGDVDGETIYDGHPGVGVYQVLREGVGVRVSLRGAGVRKITDLVGDDAGSGGNMDDSQIVVGGNITDGHWKPGNNEHSDLMAGDGDEAREGGTAEGGQLDEGHPGGEVYQDLMGRVGVQVCLRPKHWGWSKC
jgi:hypothetical protein